MVLYVFGEDLHLGVVFVRTRLPVLYFGDEFVQRLMFDLRFCKKVLDIVDVVAARWIKDLFFYLGMNGERIANFLCNGGFLLSGQALLAFSYLSKDSETSS